MNGPTSCAGKDGPVWVEHFRRVVRAILSMPLTQIAAEHLGIPTNWTTDRLSLIEDMDSLDLEELALELEEEFGDEGFSERD